MKHSLGVLFILCLAASGAASAAPAKDGPAKPVVFPDWGTPAVPAALWSKMTGSPLTDQELIILYRRVCESSFGRRGTVAEAKGRYRELAALHDKGALFVHGACKPAEYSGQRGAFTLDFASNGEFDFIGSGYALASASCRRGGKLSYDYTMVTDFPAELLTLELPAAEFAAFKKKKPGWQGSIGLRFWLEPVSAKQEYQPEPWGGRGGTYANPDCTRVRPTQYRTRKVEVYLQDAPYTYCKAGLLSEKNFRRKLLKVWESGSAGPSNAKPSQEGVAPLLR